MARINVPILLLSILLSASTWFFLYGQNLTMNVPVTVTLTEANAIGLPRHLHIDQIYPVKLQLNGPAGQVARVENEPHLNNLISVDLTSATVDQHSYPLSFDNSIAAVVQPKFVEVKLEEIITKTVPVKVEIRGILDDPTSSITSTPTSETSVIVTGRKSVVDSVTEARAVLQANEIDPNNPKSQDAPLVAVGADKRVYTDEQLQPDRVTITPIIGAAQVDKTVIVSAKIQGSPAVGYVGVNYKITPPEIQLSGPSSILLNTSSVQTETVDVTGLTETKLFKVRIITPRGASTRTTVAYVRYVVERDPGLKPGKTTATSAGAPARTTSPVPAGGGTP